MAQTDRETIRTLLTDTVTLLCRNSLPFDKSLKVQGLLGITVDEADVYIVQIDEEYDGGLLPETMVHSVPARTRVPAGRMPVKRARISATARTPVRRVVQTVPRRMGGAVGALSPGSALARQKVRQQLNFPTPHKISPMAGYSTASHGNMKPMFARESSMSSSQGSASQAFASSPVFQQSPRMPANQKSGKFRMIGDKKKTGIDRSPTITAGQNPLKTIMKTEKLESFSQRPVKMEPMQGDVICVESDEENSDVKRIPRLKPFSSSQQSTVDVMVDDKTVALEAIMAQALDQARAVSSGRGGGLCPVKSERGRAELLPRKTEDVSSSYLTDPKTIYDVGDEDTAQFTDGLDMKPVFGETLMQDSWEMGSPVHPAPSPTCSRPASLSRFSAQSVRSTSWIKAEDDQSHGMVAVGVASQRSPFFQSNDPPRKFSSPQRNWGPAGMNQMSSDIESVDNHQQDPGGNWTSDAARKLVCNIDNCDKEFATKRAMTRHQTTAHGIVSRDGAEGNSDSDTMQL